MKKKLHKLRKNNVDSKKLESFFTYLLHLNKYETAPNFIQLLKPKLEIRLFVDLAEFPCFYAVLA